MRELQLTQGKIALIDAADFDRISAFKWCASLDGRGATWYAIRRARKPERARWRSQNIRLHHFVFDVTPLELPPDHILEHENQNSLDCRRSNLRVVHKSVNMLLAPGWKNRSVNSLSSCAECGTPVLSTDFLCFKCDKTDPFA